MSESLQDTAAFAAQLAERDEVIASLKERNCELERRLGKNKANSGKPPLSDSPAKPRAQARGTQDGRPAGPPRHNGEAVLQSRLRCQTCSGEIQELRIAIRRRADAVPFRPLGSLPCPRRFGVAGHGPFGNPADPQSNNAAAQDLRLLKAKQKISGSFQAAAGAGDLAVLRSLIETARKQGWNLLSTLQAEPERLIAQLRTNDPVPEI